MPDLIIIAGCNGAGKSTFAPSFLPEGLTSFDYDRVFFVDNSKQNAIYTNLLQIEKGEIVLMPEKIPDYFKHRLPDIYELIRTE